MEHLIPFKNFVPSLIKGNPLPGAKKLLMRLQREAVLAVRKQARSRTFARKWLRFDKVQNVVYHLLASRWRIIRFV